MMFRFKALQKMREPDELDSPTLLASPRGWIATFVVGFVLCAAVVWAVVGSIPVSVSAPGLLTYPEGTVTVESPIAGTVAQVRVRPGVQVRKGQPLANVVTRAGEQPVPSPFSGTVIGQAVSDAQVITRGDPLVTVERHTVDAADAADGSGGAGSTAGSAAGSAVGSTAGPGGAPGADSGEPMVAMLFASGSGYTSLHPGQQVRLNVSTAPAARFGLLQGRISSVSPYPLTAPQVAALVGGDLAAQQYLGQGAPHLVLVELERNPDTASGFAWTTASGPPMPLHTQVRVDGTVTIAAQSPMSLVFGS